MTILNERYELQKIIGQGAFAEVWQAHDPLLDRPVAIKLLEPRLVQLEGEMLITMFQREARTVAALNHPHIVHIYDMGQQGSQLYLVMELLSGGDLYQALKAHGPYTVTDALAILWPIADALDTAHTADIIHRDIKPQNILFDRYQRPTLTDFGLVKVLSGSLYVSTPALSGGQLLGTPGYMAPEQIDDELGAISAATDIFALAVVLFELLTGQPTFRGSKAHAINHQTIYADRDKLCTRLPTNLPLPLSESLITALAIDPDQRPSGAAAWFNALTQILADEQAQQARQQVAQKQAALVQEAQQARMRQLQQKAATAYDQQQWAELQGLAYAILAEDKNHRQAQRWLAESEKHASNRLRRTAGGLLIVNDMADLRGLPQLPARILWAKDQREMCLVSAGPFTMGISEAEARRVAQQYGVTTDWALAATPAHQIALPAYYLDLTPVTQAAYARFLAANPRHPVPFVEANWARPYNWDKDKRTPLAGLENHPVVLVSWQDAAAYATWAGKQLPTEQQWEKGARGTDQRAYPWGNEWDSGKLNSAERLAGRPLSNVTEWRKWWDSVKDKPAIRTTPVGAYPAGASPYGLVDMAGNVWDWCADWFEPYPDNQHNRNDYGQQYRVLRGGSWIRNLWFVRSSYRYGVSPVFRNYNVGFRCASSAP